MTEYLEGGSVRNGEAVVASSVDGLRVTKWTVPLSSDDPGKTEPTGGWVYRARLSAADHRNSSGEVLKTVGGILRQDRANGHSGRGDQEDGGDPVFPRRLVPPFFHA